MTTTNVSEVKVFVIQRTFNASRALVWKAWTDHDSLMQWFGPKGVTMSAAKLDFRPGGIFHYCMQTPDGKAMWGKFTYREIVAPEKIVLINSFSDEKGGVIRHPFSSTWPLEMVSTSTFAEKDGKTTITISWVPYNPTDAELDTFNSSHASMQQGWTGTFDQLEAYLAKTK